MPHLGDAFEFVRVEIELISAGPISMILGRGIVLGIGEADRGPVLEPFGLASIGEIERYYGGGKLAEGLKQAIWQGADAVFGVNVKGTGYATAETSLTDGLSSPQTVGRFVATSPGRWGEDLRFIIENGELNNWLYQSFYGDGTAEYPLDMHGIVSDSHNWVKILHEGVTTTKSGSNLVYDVDDLVSGKVFIDPDGNIKFYTGEEPSEHDKVSVGLLYHTKKITIWLGQNVPNVYNNIRSQVQLEAVMASDPYCTYDPVLDPVTGEPVTHLPGNVAGGKLTGGEDGDPITAADYEMAFEAALGLPENIIPTCVFVTEYECAAGTYDIIPYLSGYLTEMGDRKTPCLGFTATRPSETVTNLLNLKSGYNNIWMTIGGNYYDQYGNLIVGARAGMEAAVSLGESCADPINSMQNINGLLTIFKKTDRETLTYNGVDVLIKRDGIRPYVGINTNLDDNFRRCVDMRTCAWIVIAIDAACYYYTHKRRTKINLNNLKGSLDAFLERLLTLKILDYYATTVAADKADRNGVIIEMWVQPVGHMERFYVKFYYGNLEKEPV